MLQHLQSFMLGQFAAWVLQQMCGPAQRLKLGYRHLWHCDTVTPTAEVGGALQTPSGLPAIKSILKPTAARAAGCASLRLRMCKVRIQEGS